nr:MAG TPA: hypothetical protein [Caudoviricetes sp.]
MCFRLMHNGQDRYIIAVHLMSEAVLQVHTRNYKRHPGVPYILKQAEYHCTP